MVKTEALPVVKEHTKERANTSHMKLLRLVINRLRIKHIKPRMELKGPHAGRDGVGEARSTPENNCSASRQNLELPPKWHATLQHREASRRPTALRTSSPSILIQSDRNSLHNVWTRWRRWPQGPPPSYVSPMSASTCNATLTAPSNMIFRLLQSVSPTRYP